MKCPFPPISPHDPPPLWKWKHFFAALLQSCSSDPVCLRRAHALLLTTGLSVKNSLVTQLLCSLSLLGHMSYARQLFDEMHKPRSFLWNVLIRGYAKNDNFADAASLYRLMRSSAVRPDPFTFPFVVKACAELADLWATFAVHADALKHGLDRVSMVRTELIVMYVKFGDLGRADYLFERMPDRDLVAWNAFIAACVQNGFPAKCLELFRQMGSGDGLIKPDSMTIVAAISACGDLGYLETGEEIFRSATTKSILGNIFVDNARLDMYTKCGSLDLARTMFEEMPKRTVVSWSTMIRGYAINGESDTALWLFSRMQSEGLKPNNVTFLGVLWACSHAGLVSKGWAIFNRMVQSKDRDLQPRKEHYACMVDLLGRSGQLVEAYIFIKSMPIDPDPGIWGALLGACAIHHNVELGQHVADLLFQLAPDVASYHVLLSNMYAASGRWNDVEKVRQRMRQKSTGKVAAYSSIEFDGKIHVLYGGDRSHPQSDYILRKLEDLISLAKSVGYVPKTGSVLHDVEMEEKEAQLWGHSEKLAIALGLINVRPGLPIRVTKNLRVCEDCHTFSKYVSRMTMREIIMRDKIRLHHFKGGVCSCKDFW